MREQEKEGGKYRERQDKNSLLEIHFSGLASDFSEKRETSSLLELHIRYRRCRVRERESERVCRRRATRDH